MTKDKWKVMKMNELFSDSEIADIDLIIRERDWDCLRKYLNDRKEMLEKKGVVADYLYYYLLNKFRDK